jgi:hypothetical protein
MELADYIGKRFTLVLTDENGETVAFSGWVASEAGQTLHLQREGGSIALEREWLERIRRVDTDELKGVLPDADFLLPLTVGSKLEENGKDLPTGMRWPV